MAINATYCAEDNKLRLYASEWLDDETYNKVGDAGFKWAPKQELFVAPKWTPAREDLCIELAGEITAEDTTLAERAQAKAERLDDLATKRAKQAGAYHAAAHRISERFAGGQPILVGHHSERRARKDKAAMDQAMQNAVAALDAVNYWNYRAEGVERHANYKSSPKVRARRIKTLLAELRDRQRNLNHANLCLDLWLNIESIEDKEEQDKKTLFYAGAHLKNGAAAPYYKGKSLYCQLEDGETSTAEAINKCIAFHEFQAESAYTARWINHILNRLAFERSELGPVTRFTKELTPVILQAFARTHGADKPKVTKSGTGFLLVSPVPLPLHLAEGKELDLTSDEWRDLMESVGYEVVVKARKAPKKQTCPLINPTVEQAEKLQALWNADASKKEYGKPSERQEVTQAYYSANSQGDYGKFHTISIDKNGRRIWQNWQNKSADPVCRVRMSNGSGLYSADRVITLTDKPKKELPIDFEAIDKEAAA